MRHRLRVIPVFLLLLLPVFAQQTDPSLLTVDSLFSLSHEIARTGAVAKRWQRLSHLRAFAN